MPIAPGAVTRLADREVDHVDVWLAAAEKGHPVGAIEVAVIDIAFRQDGEEPAEVVERSWPSGEMLDHPREWNLETAPPRLPGASRVRASLDPPTVTDPTGRTRVHDLGMAGLLRDRSSVIGKDALPASAPVERAIDPTAGGSEHDDAAVGVDEDVVDV